MIYNIWQVDFQTGTGILDIPNSSEDRKALDTMTSSITCIEDGHYQLALLWKDKDLSLPYNKVMAEQRLVSLKQRLTKDLNLKKNTQ